MGKKITANNNNVPFPFNLLVIVAVFGALGVAFLLATLVLLSPVILLIWLIVR